MTAPIIGLNPMDHGDPLDAIESWKCCPEGPLAAWLADQTRLKPAARAEISAQAVALIQELRQDKSPGLMEVFLAEYGLSTDEGVALMCLAEALLRVPDAPTIDALIADKIAPNDWQRHLGRSASALVNASSWALMLTGRVLDAPTPSFGGVVQNMAARLGAPVIRTALRQAMREMGRQFVLGQDIAGAMARAQTAEAQGYCYSYDMLGEAAQSQADADGYSHAYAEAITAIARRCKPGDPMGNPGISIKLSALHPRYEPAQSARVLAELVPVVARLARQAAAANMGLSIDAEEADRLNLSLQVVQAVLEDLGDLPWDGFGIVVQAYGRRAMPVIDWIYDLAGQHKRRIAVRLVKGAYWDSEIKQAQIEGLQDFPVFTQKPASDVSYLACARRLLDHRARLYPQFATHNAHSLAAVLHMGKALPQEAFELQRLHGMGAALHELLRGQTGRRCRIYAPVGAHRDLLAYLVRRLLENGANSSFVHQILDDAVPAEAVAACPIAQLGQPGPRLPSGAALYLPERQNSAGYDLSHGPSLGRIERARQGSHLDAAYPLLARNAPQAAGAPLYNPATGAKIGTCLEASAEDIATALEAAAPWQAPARARAEILRKAADLYEAESGAIFALLAREAGKTLPDAVAELREAVDFLRYYAGQADMLRDPPWGVFACISPWNFPLAIFTGQIAAALAAGNGVLAKPAEQTPLIATLAVSLLHRAGVPRTALQCLPGDGARIGGALTGDPRVQGIAFTGSTETAQVIRRAMADHLPPGAPLIAETGGLNAMIVDSTALLEQAVQDIIASAFQSAGQRCSALRCLYVQEEIAPDLLRLLQGAMAELSLGDPWPLSCDIGPVIDAKAREDIRGYLGQARSEGRVIAQCPAPEHGHFIGPALLRVGSIADIPREIFGPVLHVASFKASALDAVIEAINATGYGLTFGLHSRIETRMHHITQQLRAGNLYVNRNQIGAVVGSQPFGGEGLSGTGPKAGGPHYLARFTRPCAPDVEPSPSLSQNPVDLSALQAQLDAAQRDICLGEETLPGPTGEANLLRQYARAPLLCLGPGREAAQAQQRALAALGGYGIVIDPPLSPAALRKLQGFSGALWWGDEDLARRFDQALASRPGPILPLITHAPDAGHARLERHVCINTAAAGGNTELLNQPPSQERVF
ncbi:MAG: bifunctional proline dehydrogenase/L-glutamate gamma-semialdehyde dehydrogenase PutA [Mangrovicoccus sp.]|nr:bifunctional proline dehydrogenase/L-glutamate gamma-semialdehyde dehydrogenase PutA [Mangrovicoccus sp.]